MKRIQIHIDEELDQALAARAVRERTSKSALVRQFVSECLAGGKGRGDPLDEVVGCSDEEPGNIDALVYGP